MYFWYCFCIILFHNNNRNIFFTMNPFPIHLCLINNNIISLWCFYLSILQNRINDILFCLLPFHWSLYFFLLLFIVQLFFSEIEGFQIIFIFYRLAMLLHFLYCRLDIYLYLLCTIFINVALKSLTLYSALERRSAVKWIIDF